jgi:O-methyltransferase involved in polyketide biosynthesis
MVNFEKVTSIGVQETTLATLYGKAMESQRPDSILGDRPAYDALRRIDHDFGKFRMRPRHAKALAIRAKAYGGWVRRFLESCPECAVLHLGCGLDTRVYRVNPPATVRWEIPGDASVLVVAEGLIPYLRTADGLTQRSAAVKASGAQLDWSIDDPHEFETLVPGLVFDSDWWHPNMPETERHYSWLARELLRILFHITPVRRLGRGLHYHFGA